MKIAVLIDGGFFLRRFRHVYRDLDDSDPSVVADTAHKMAIRHLSRKVTGNGKVSFVPDGELYRIFFYDCPPVKKKLHFPVSRRSCDLSKTDAAKFRDQLHLKIVRKRKVALRLGRLDDANGAWQMRPGILKELLSGKRDFSSLVDDDFFYYARQKLVDMKIGLDISSLAYEGHVKRIILISGDSDFVPAAKMARRRGVDFILDPMRFGINPDLHEHIDGLRSTCPNPDYGKKKP